MLSFNYEVYGVKQITVMFSRMADRIKDWRPAFRKVAKDFRQVSARQFASEGDRKSKWKPLNPKYAKWKARNYPGQPMMVQTGELRGSLTTRGAPGSVEDVSRMSLRVGTTNLKAKWHFRAWKGRPARRVIDLTPRDKSRWIKFMHEYMVEIIKQVNAGRKVLGK